MNISTKILDTLREKQGIPSDYQVAKMLGYTKATVGHWRTGHAQMGPDAIAKIAPLIGEDAAELTATVEAERAKTDEAKAIMQALADSRMLEMLIASGAVKVDKAAVRAAVAAIEDEEKRKRYKGAISRLFSRAAAAAFVVFLTIQPFGNSGTARAADLSPAFNNNINYARLKRRKKKAAQSATFTA